MGMRRLSGAGRVAEEGSRRVPGADLAVVEDRKLTGWVLAEHGHGPDFRRALGVEPEDRELVRDALFAHVRERPVESVRAAHPLAGPEARNWAVVGPLEIRGRRTWVRSVWQVSAPGAPPRFITAYPFRPG